MPTVAKVADLDRRVLIVDDDQQDSQTLKNMLRSNGYQVKIATNHESAIALSQQFQPDVCLLDARLAERDFTFINTLRIRTPATVQVMMTPTDPANSASQVAINVLQMGAYDYLLKPLQPQDTIATLERCFERIRLNKERGLNVTNQIQEKALITLEAIGDAVITTDTNGIIDYLNPSAEQLTGWVLAQAKNKPLTQIFNIINEISREPASDPVIRCLKEDRIVGLANHTVLIRNDMQEIAIEDSAAPIRNEKGHIVGVVLVFHDVTQARKLAKQITYQAHHDPLTGLINRTEFERRAEKALETAHTHGATHSLLYIDLDNFKIVNDTCGHLAGDQLLKQVTNLLQKNLRSRDSLARLGGDEFSVLLEHCTVEQAHEVAENMLKIIREFHFIWAEQQFSIGASIGIAAITSDCESLSALLEMADTACYNAKFQGRDCVYLFTQSDEAHKLHLKEQNWISRITHAFEKNLFQLCCQPIVHAQAHDTLHWVEVFIRLADESGDCSLPGAFLPAAERYNLVQSIDRWVVRNVFELLARTVDNNTTYCINLSSATISDPIFLEFLQKNLQSPNINAKHVCFELSETAALTNLANAVHFTTEVRKLGAYVALDNFGSGISSYTYLSTLPVDMVKIHGMFIKNMTDEPVQLTIVKSIIDICHLLELKVIATHVENEKATCKLKTLGVDYLQGYHLGRPTTLNISS